MVVYLGGGVGGDVNGVVVLVVYGVVVLVGWWC